MYVSVIGINILKKKLTLVSPKSRCVSQIKSNQILFKVGNVHLKEKKISKKLFT